MKIKHLGVILTAAIMSFTLLLAGCGKNKGGGGNDYTVDDPDILGVAAPVYGLTPSLEINETDQFTGTVSWEPVPPEGTFEAETVYTATITLTAKTGYTFDGVASNFFRVDGAETTSNAASSGVVTAAFAATGSVEMKAVTIENITGVTVPGFGLPAVDKIDDTAQFTGRVEWHPEVPDTFAADTVYTATITLTPEDGYTFVGLPENFFKVTGAGTVTYTVGSNTVTAVFPETGNQAPDVVDIKVIGGVTPPVYNAQPVDEITGNDQFTGTVSWEPAVAEGGVFAPETPYTAIISLVEKPGYTLYGVAADFFEVAGATTVTNLEGRGEVRAVFPATGSAPPSNVMFTPAASYVREEPVEAGTVVGTLSATSTQTVTYTLVEGDGTNDRDNGSFDITGNEVKVKGTALAKGTYYFYVRAENIGGHVFYAATLTVNEAPPSDIRTETVWEGSYDTTAGGGNFIITKSGGTQFNPPHAGMDFDLIVPGGYIEVTYTSGPLKLGLHSVEPKHGSGVNPHALYLDGADSGSGVRRFNHDDILDAIENDFGFDGTGTRNPTIMSILTIEDATITKVTVTYDSNHHLLRTFDTFAEVGGAAATYGDMTRIKRALAKAEAGQPITIVFLGGSITEAGSGNAGYSFFDAAPPDDGYSGKVARWFYSTYSQSAITYVNHGTGGVPSSGGLGWLDNFSGASGGLLKGPDGTASTRLHEPDLVFIEFSVNDSMSGWTLFNQGNNLDTMIGRILNESEAGVIVLCSFNLWDGLSADVVHSMAAAKHNVSVVNHRAALWPNIRAGVDIPTGAGTTPAYWPPSALSNDGVHPNANGDIAYADNIKYFLEQVKAQPSYVFPTGLTLTPLSLEPIPRYQTRQLTATIAPNTATNRAVLWTSSNESVATVDQNGEVTAHAVGNAAITARSQDAPHLYETRDITVIDGDPTVSLKSATTLNLNNNQITEQLTATTVTSGSNTFFWTSSDEFVATVDQNGLVTGWRSGDARIRATSTENEAHFAECAVSVRGTVFPAGMGPVANLENVSGGTADVVLWEGPEEFAQYYFFEIKSMDQDGGVLNPAWIVSGDDNYLIYYYGPQGWFGISPKPLVYLDSNGATQTAELWTNDQADFGETGEEAYYAGGICGWNVSRIENAGIDPMNVKSISMEMRSSLERVTLLKIVLTGIPYIAP